MASILAPLHFLSRVLILYGLAFALPMLTALLMNDGTYPVWWHSILAALASGSLIWVLTRRFRRELTSRDGIVLVVLIWVLLPLISAFPLMQLVPGLHFTDAYLEATSGLTATGATVISGLDALPPSVNLWRTEMHWIGGMGVIVLVVAVLPLLGVGGRQLFKAETPTPMKDSNLTPRMAETAKGLWQVYVMLTALCVLALWAGGMSGIDAVIHAFSVMGLGGMSSHDTSMDFYDSPLLECIVVVFALIAAVNFSTHFMALRSRNLLPYRHDNEIPWVFGVLGASVVGIALLLWHDGVYATLLESLRHSLFHTISVATTLGFSGKDYSAWPAFAPLWMLFLSSFAASSGSTGGGIKMLRAALLFHQVGRELKKLLHPHAEVHTKIGTQVVPNKITYAVLAFFFIYIASVFVLSLVLVLSGLDEITAFTAIVATINNTGPGLGAVGPASTYGVLTDFQAWVCSFAMLLGRLELFTLLVVLTPAFWRK